MLTREADKRMPSSMKIGYPRLMSVCREAGIQRTKAASNKHVILPERELV